MLKWVGANGALQNWGQVTKSHTKHFTDPLSCPTSLQSVNQKNHKAAFFMCQQSCEIFILWIKFEISDWHLTFSWIYHSWNIVFDVWFVVSMEHNSLFLISEWKITI